MKSQSVLVERIVAAIDGLGARSGLTVHVSVAADTRWGHSGGDEVHVRWLCWSIDRAGQEVTDPEFEVVSPTITREVLAKELPPLFAGMQVLVDDDIEV